MISSRWPPMPSPPRATKSEKLSRPPMPHSLSPPQRLNSSPARLEIPFVWPTPIPSAPPLPESDWFCDIPTLSPSPFLTPVPSAPPLPEFDWSWDIPTPSPSPFLTPSTSAHYEESLISLALPEPLSDSPAPPRITVIEQLAGGQEPSSSRSPALPQTTFNRQLAGGQEPSSSRSPAPPSNSRNPAPTPFNQPPLLRLAGAPPPPPSPGGSSSSSSSSSGSPPSSPTQLPDELALLPWREAMRECLKEAKAQARKEEIAKGKKEVEEKAEADDKGKGKAVVISGGAANRQTTVTDVYDRLITDPNTDKISYKTAKIIGNAAGDALIFKSLFLGFETAPRYDELHISDFFFGLRVVDIDCHRQESRRLIEQAHKNQVIDNANILGIKDIIEFEDHFFCLSFPRMNSSLRSLIDTTFPTGFPQVLIAIALREVLQGLVYIHQKGDCHQELNAGHIYFRHDARDPAIKIGFAATIYEDHPKVQRRFQDFESGNMPRETICEWGAAPEIYHLKQGYTEKSDIWLVGITGMELDYGGLPVKDREQLENLIQAFLVVTDRDKRGDKKNKSGVGKQLDKVKKKLGKLKAGSNPSSMSVGVSFKEMLASCLKQNPEERPTAEGLLQHDFFQIFDDGYNLHYFRKAVLDEKEKKKQSCDE